MRGLSLEPKARDFRHVRLLTSRSLSALLISAGLLLGSTACTRVPEKPPESALKQAKKDSRLEQQEELDPERRHLAPPPAYGNKVVMARSEDPKARSF